MKFVAVSDLHYDKDTLGVPRLNDVRRLADQAVEHTIKIKADGFLFLGDLSDPDSGGASWYASAQAIAIARRLANAMIRSVWLAGNHDVVEDGTGMTTLSPLAAAGINFVTVFERPGVTNFNDVVILALPYTPISHAYDPALVTRELLGTLLPQQRVITLSHLMVPGVLPGEETHEMPRGRDVIFPLEETKHVSVRLQGHFHRQQVFDPGDGGPPIHVVGAPTPFCFSEEGYKSAFLEIDI